MCFRIARIALEWKKITGGILDVVILIFCDIRKFRCLLAEFEMLSDAGDQRVGDLSFAIDQVDRVIDLKI